MQILRGWQTERPRSWRCNGAEARLGKKLKKEIQAWPREIRKIGLEGKKEEKEKKNGQSLSEFRSKSWRLLAKQTKASERVLGEICPERDILGNGGIRQPSLWRPTSEAETVLAGGGGRAQCCNIPDSIMYV